MCYPDNKFLLAFIRDFLVQGLIFAIIQTADLSFTYNRLLVSTSGPEMFFRGSDCRAMSDGDSPAFFCLPNNPRSATPGCPSGGAL